MSVEACRQGGKGIVVVVKGSVDANTGVRSLVKGELEYTE